MKKGWKIKRLADVLELQNGYAFDSKGFNPTDGLPLIRIRSLKAGVETETRFNGDYDKKYVVKAGDLLIGMDGEFGCYDWKGEPSLLNQRVCRLQGFSGELIPRFLFYGVNDYLKAIEDVTGYTTVKHISSKQILEIEFPVPPLAEQQRIVGLLDEAFEGLATAKANAEKNLQNARDLFESHLYSIFTQRGPGWVDSTIGPEIKFIDYRGKTPVKTASGVRLITAKNVKMGFLQETPMEFIAATNYEGWMTRGIPQKGDVLFTTEAPLANVAQLDTDEKVAFAQRIIIMQPNAARLDSTFLKYLLLSLPVQQRIRTKGTGATVQGIKASLLKRIEISFPESLTTQKEIVNKLDDIREESHRLARLYEQKHAALEALKKSLLHQAFTGEL